MPDALLVRHFLRRFLENDLVSPDADRHEVLAVTTAALAMSGLFAAVMLSRRYLFHPLQSRAWTALVSLEDAFVCCGLAMVVSGVAAVAVWDALALDGRDAAIFRALPVRRIRVVTAQLIAVCAFGLAIVTCVSVVPSIVAPLVRVSRLPIGMLGVVRLMGVQLIAMMLAGLFGFITVFALREVVRALVGRAFDRVAPAVQCAVVAVLATGLLLLPFFSTEVGKRFLVPGSVVPPPMWFVGVHEALVGDALIRLPATPIPLDAPAAESLRQAESRMFARYHGHVPALRALAATAVSALSIVTVIAALAWAWNSRRWPQILPVTHRRSAVMTRAVRTLTLAAGRSPAERAGFAFARQVLARSPRHRVWGAATLGGVIATATFSLQGLSLTRVAAPSELSAAVLGLQTLLLLAALAGYRHTTNLPADPRASLTFDIAAFDDVAGFARGVKRAGIVLVGIPLLLVMFVFMTWLAGGAVAAAHFLLGLALLLAVAEAFFFRPSALPLVVPRPPAGNPASMALLYVLAAIAGSSMLAVVEHAALQPPQRFVALALLPVAVWATLVQVSRRRPREPLPRVLQPQTDLASMGLSE
jgi:hypothetical protein